MKPICYDLYCGLGGWSEGFLAEGYECVGFDTEAHDYGTGGYPGKLVIRDVRSIHGSELKDAAVIVASPPCQKYSYMAMPWQRAKDIAHALRNDQADLFPEGYEGPYTVEHLNLLFNECFRIQREAIAAAGHHIPLIVENVRGAQPWVGRARWNYGSFYLWGDVPALMPQVKRCVKIGTAGDFNMDWSNYGKPGYKGKGFNGEAIRRMKEASGVKGVPHRTKGHWTNPAEHEGVKSITLGGNYAERKARGDVICLHGSKSSARKAASAMIAKIPFPLSQHIARAYKPHYFNPKATTEAP